MCAATPTFTAFSGSDFGPLVYARHPGLEQCKPTLWANELQTACVKSALNFCPHESNHSNAGHSYPDLRSLIQIARTGRRTEVLPRKRGERTQRGNPHQLTREQHVIPAATLKRFAGPDGLVEVHLQDERVTKLPVDNQLFCVERLWDQRAEAGYMKTIEDNFQALVTDLENGRSAALLPKEHEDVTRFWSLLHWRNHFMESPADAPELKGIKGENLSIDQKEILESQWAAFADADNKLPIRTFVGMRIQMLIDIDTVQAHEKRWGILRSPQAQLILSDRPGRLMSITASPRILLAADNPDGYLTPEETHRANCISIARSRNFVIVPPR